MPDPVVPPQYPAEARRARVERQQSVEDGVTTLAYRLHFTTVGEQSVELNFPCRFINEPVVGGGGFSLAPGSVLEPRRYPTASAGALFETETLAGHVYYVGALAVIVMTGSRRQQMTVHLSFTGKAIVGPVTEASA